MMALNVLQQQVKDAIIKYADRQPRLFDPTPLLSQIDDLFEQHQQQYNPRYENQPQGMDPYGGVPDEAGPLEHTPGR